MADFERMRANVLAVADSMPEAGLRTMLEAMTPADLAAEGRLFGQVPLARWQIVEAAYEHGLWTLGQTVPYVRLRGGTPRSYGIVPMR